MIQKNLNNEEVLWTITRDMNPIAQKLADRHYSRKHPGSRKGFVGPGKKIVLITANEDALFVWLRADPEMRLDGIDGINKPILPDNSYWKYTDLDTSNWSEQ